MRNGSIPRSTTSCASVRVRCRRAVIARVSSLDESIRINACFTAAPVRRARRSALAWCRTRAPAASGGQAACGRHASRSMRTPSVLREMGASGFPIDTVTDDKVTDAKPVTACIARKFVLGGRVQGVGFRPFVYRVAHRCGVNGWVRNRAGEVEVLAQGYAELLQRFRQALVAEAPPLARPKISRGTVSRAGARRKFSNPR